MSPQPPGDLEAAATRLGKVLGESCLLIGGMAVAAWGRPRATGDVDFASLVEPEVVLSALEKAGIDAALVRGEPLEDPLAWVIRGSTDNVPFQVIAPPVELHVATAVRIQVGDQPLRVVGLEDLLALKLVAGGMRDLWDVACILKDHAELLPRARARAEAAGVADKLEAWLQDPRLE